MDTGRLITRPLRFVSIFSGIEAASVAWEPLGWEPVALSEIEAFPRAVLEHRILSRFPECELHGDMTAVDWSRYRGEVDLVVGGPPCQAFSVAGLRKSLADDRGNLSLEYVRAIHAIDPRWALTENVPGWLSTKDNAFGCFLAGLVGADAPLVSPLERGRWTDAGVVSGPLRTAAWRIVDAQFYGVAQRRRRVFVLSVRGSGDWSCAEALFPQWDGVPRYTPPSREAGERPAPTLGSGAPFSRTGNERVEVGALVFMVANPLTARMHKGVNTTLDEGQTLITHTLRGDGFDASEDGTGRGTPMVPVPILEAGARTGKSTTDPRAGSGIGEAGDPMYTLQAGKQHAVGLGMAVRRITPTEAERLQGFPDGWTAIPWRGKPADQCPDGPRYKALGNSMAVPVVRWIGRRIEAVMATTGAVRLAQDYV